MKKNVLLVDLGNSSFKWARSYAGELSAMVKSPYTEKMNSDFFIQHWDGVDKPDLILVSCVANKSVWALLNQACLHLWNVNAEKVIPGKEGFGIMNAYEKPLELGSDRWCGMIGAKQETNSAFIVIDSGSALTIDIVDQSGIHKGGYILPGLNMMKNSLGLQTAQVNIKQNLNKKPLLTPGTSTTSCVEAAIHLSTVKMIESVIGEQQGRSEDLTCFITGGNAEIIADLLSYKCVIMPDVVLRGLAYISQNDFSL